ncbi:tetratricopeptide repeat protein [Pseudoalteromonas xiamenensis]
MVKFSFIWLSFGLFSAVPSAFAGIDYSRSELLLEAPSVSVPVFTYRDKQQSLTVAPHEAAFMTDLKPLLEKQQYAKVAEAFSGRVIEKDSPALLQLQGQVLLTLKRYPDAIKVLSAAVSKAPELVSAQRSLALAYILNKQPNEARAPIQTALSLGANEAALYGQLAFLNLQQYGPWSAIAGYRQALFLEPTNAQWKQGLAHALTQAHAYSEAGALLTELINQDTDNVQWWLQAAFLELNQQQFEKALHRLDVAMRLAKMQKSTSYNADNLLLLAKLHIQYGSTQAGLTALDSALSQTDKKDTAKAEHDVVQLAAWFASQEKWSALQDLFTLSEKRKLSKASSAMWLAKAKHALATKQVSKAEKLLLDGLSSSPSDGNGLLLLANLYREAGNRVDAVVYYQRASAIEEVKEAALLGQAQLYIDGKDYAKAVALLRQVLKHNPQRHELRANIKNLEQLMRYEG